VHWPADHPARTDLPLARWRADVDAICPDAQAVALLRHVPGRRVTTLIERPDGPAVVKLFASPRARGNDRRLRALRPATQTLVPRPLGVGPAGHALVLEYVPGQPLPELSGPAFVAACEQVGRSLARLQNSGVRLDRAWTAQDEIDHLHRQLPPDERRWKAPEPGPLLPAHRDLHPGQIVVEARAVRLIDLDDATMAPPGLDVGNFLAHLDRETAVGARSESETAAAARAFVRGYGAVPRDLHWWRQVALARLAVLAEARHGRRDWAASLRALLD